MFVVGIENYGDTFLYFYEFRNMKEYLTLVFMAFVNEKKLDKYGLC